VIWHGSSRGGSAAPVAMYMDLAWAFSRKGQGGAGKLFHLHLAVWFGSGWAAFPKLRNTPDALICGVGRG
jgi:hypothetical protein